MKLMPWSITLILLVLLGAAISAVRQWQHNGPANSTEQSAAVTAQNVTNQLYLPRRQVSGVLKAPQYLQLTNELSGTVSRLNFSSGAIVEKDQVLLEIDHQEELARLAATEVRLAQQQKTVQRYQQLYQGQKVSTEALELAQARLSELRAEQQVLQSVIAKKVLKAPFRARAGIHDLQPGQFLERNLVLTSLIGLTGHSWVDFSVPQSLPELAPGAKVDVYLPGQSEPVTAEVMSVEAQVSAQLRQLRYRASLPLPQQQLRANQLVQVDFATGEQQQLPAIPATAIVRDQLGDYVYLLEKDQAGVFRARRQQVQLGPRLGEQVLVTAGLQQAQLIANEGAFKLRDGLRAEVTPTPASSFTAATEF
ncbi:efflux RND transporter periplasmic adaptor subunit [Rheinheimera sp.]|uniref:efflux RND transporter periplasmic adaptor subunit n=1 Tax=Rheinheimera sp. TaxID=1869214 RepID=UPI0027BA809C|nr:efflux RND transporter periplasmic adaptor subunit [Rheinheimera sp.]